MGKSIARSPVRGGWHMGHPGLAQDPESGGTTECKGQRKEEEEQTHLAHAAAFPDRRLLLQVPACSARCSIQAAVSHGLDLLIEYLAGSRVPRFDPTAYIQDRQRRQKEAEIKKLVSSISPLMIEPSQLVFFFFF